MAEMSNCQCVRYSDVDLLSRASRDVQSLPSEGGTDFEARWLFIATWYSVTHYGAPWEAPVRLRMSYEMRMVFHKILVDDCW